MCGVRWRPEPSDAIVSEAAVVQPVLTIHIDGTAVEGQAAEPLIALLQRAGTDLPAVCYHPSLGPLQTCDTCWVVVDGKLVRACATPVWDGMRVETETDRARDAREEGMQRILTNHELYCTVCENNN